MTRDDLEQIIYERTRRFVDLDVLDGILELIAAEREACAKVCVSQTKEADGSVDYSDACHDNAAAIRARGQA